MPRQPRLSAILSAERVGVAPGATTPRQRPLRTPERVFQRQVVALAKLHGWWAYHNPDSRRSAAGMPDLLILRPPRALFVELKRIGSHATERQVAVMYAMKLSGLDVRLWTPDHWPEIQTTLAAPREENA